MSKDVSQQNPDELARPISSFVGPIAELIGQGMLSPPSRLGVLATVDRFEVLRILGGGGMGVVLLARDPNTAREVAVKMIKADLVGNQQIVHRFVKEAGHLQRLRHANVTPVLEVSDRPQGPYFVMPYFERESLAKRIQIGRALEPALILDIASQIAEGLRYAHQHGIIHRDLKPANILLAENDKACLADFGLARTMFNDTIVDVESQQCEGTAHYMSPAVAAGNAEDTRCDIYAFGALLYEMLTGEPPYKGQSTKEVQKQILAGPPKPITALNPKADRGLVTVAEGAMARELRDRYANMADVLADLARIKDCKPPFGAHGTVRKARYNLLRGRLIIKISWIAACLAVIATLSWILWPRVPERPLIFQTPRGVAVDSAGNIYVVDGDNSTIGKIAPSRVVSTLAGMAGTPGIVDGTGSNARFSILRGAAVDSDGNVYVADSYTIRKITTEGVVSTLAGKAGASGIADALGSKARFSVPCGVAVDGAGNVYVADMYTIRKITSAGMVSTLAGTPRHAGSTDGVGARVRFSDQAKGVAVDNVGNVYVADTANDVIRKIAPEGTVSTFAGMVGHTGSDNGPGSNARFYRPQGITVDSAGNIYVADTDNNTIRKITPAGVVNTMAGADGQSGNADGTGSNARFDHPQAITVDGRGNLYVADTGNHTIRKVTPNGVVSTLTGRQSNVNGSAQSHED
jgi:sugar lactone lactonase YvrE